MNRKVIGLVLGLILVLSSVLVFSVLTNYPNDSNHTGSQSDATSDDINNEVDGSFLEENSEIEIGEMV